MADVNEPICFHCGQVFAANGRFNHLPDGRPCPLCSDRLMASLPPLLPFRDESAPAWVEDEDEDPSERDEDYAPTYLRAVQDRPEPA